MLSVIINDAQEETCLHTREELENLKSQPLDSNSIQAVSSLSYQDLWMAIAEKETAAVQQIIEFAKMVPGFMRLLQDDQIMLLKGGEYTSTSAAHSCFCLFCCSLTMVYFRCSGDCISSFDKSC